VATGYIAKLRIERTEGHFFNLDFTPEDVKKHWAEVTSFNRKNDYPTSGRDTLTRVAENLERIENLPKPKL
jgi:multifunctional beta-oxidation protein